MQLIKYFIVALILILTTCQSEIVVADETSLRIIVQDLVYIVTSCYGGRVDAVGLAGNLPDNLIRSLAQHSLPVVLIDDTAKNLVSPHRLNVQFHHRLRIFIVGTSSSDHLASIIDANRNYAIWWDHMASYFIFDSSPDCRNSAMFLYVAWVSGLINAKVICHVSGEDEAIITTFGAFKPFTSKAQGRWKLVRVFHQKQLHHWPLILYAKYFRKNKAICVDLDFDKMVDLNGYEFPIHGDRLPLNMLDQKTYPFSYNFFTTSERIMRTVLDVLHANPKFLGDSIQLTFNNTSIQFIPKGINFEVSCDAITYPHALSGFVIVTKFRGNKSQLNKILTVVDINSRYGIGVVYLITLIFLKFFVHHALVPALLNLVRITCNTGFANLPNNTAPRIYLTSLLFFVVTIQGIYQGNLATLLTTAIPVRNVNTMQDLVDLGYEKMYGGEGVKTIIEHPYIREHFISVKDYVDCISFTKNDSLAACITIADGTIDLAAHAKLHVSNKFVAPVYNSFPTGTFWPFKDRVNKIISRMVESSVLEPWDVKCTAVQFTDYEFDEEVKANVNFKNIEISEVTFSFVILGIGLVCASIVFIIELVVHHFQSRAANVRVQVLN